MTQQAAGERAPEGKSDGKHEGKHERKLSHAERQTEEIIGHLNEYLEIRFDHAARVNPKLRHIKSDLLYHEFSNVRRTLLGEKIYGPIKMVVADVFLSDDDVKRRRLISATDQTSIQVDLVSHCQDEKVEATRGQIKFHDLKSFYAAIDPALVDFIDLLESWIWWDILDAVELVRFEQKLGKINRVKQGKLGDDMRRRYSLIVHPLTDPEQPVTVATDDEILRYEIEQLQAIRHQWRFRHHMELGYKFVLQREEEPAPSQGEMIKRIADKVREYDAIDSLSDVNDDLQHAYGPDLKVQPARVTKPMILDHLQEQLVDLERDMLKQSEGEAKLGPPYNFKERQLEMIERYLHELLGQFGHLMEKAPEPKPQPMAGFAPTAAPASAQPAPQKAPALPPLKSAAPAQPKPAAPSSAPVVAEMGMMSVAGASDTKPAAAPVYVADPSPFNLEEHDSSLSIPPAAASTDPGFDLKIDPKLGF